GPHAAQPVSVSRAAERAHDAARVRLDRGMLAARANVIAENIHRDRPGRAAGQPDLPLSVEVVPALESSRVRLPFFYGWIVFAGAFVTTAVGVNARTTFSLLFPPILD